MKWIYSLLLALLVMSFQSLHAQDYDLAVGIRAGSASGITLKKFIGYSTAVEGMILYRQGGARVTTLFEGHIPIADDLYLMLGAGGHIGFTSSVFAEDRYNQMVAGVDAIAGLEYVFPRSPVAISFDLKPSLELISGTRLSGNNAGVTLKYLLN